MAPAATAAADEDTVYRVVEAFSFDYNGRTYAMRKGDIVAADHPSQPTSTRRSLYEQVTAAAAREATVMRTQVSAVETATAAPGEHRRMEIDHSVPEDAVTASVPPGPPTPAPTGEPNPPAPPPPPTPSGEQTDADAVETTEQAPGTGRRGKGTARA